MPPHHLTRRPALASTFCLLVCVGCPALGGDGGGDDEVGGDGFCYQECEERLQCFYSDVEDPGPGDWKADGDPFCTDGMSQFEGLDPSMRAIEIREYCRQIVGGFVGPVDFDFYECSSPTGYDCSGWSPAPSVRTIAATEFHVGRTLVDALLNVPTPLLECDTARFGRLEDDAGYFVSSSSRDDFVYALGLREGDRIVALNGYSIANSSEAIGALIYFRQHGETEYELTLERGDEQLAFHYEIVQEIGK